MTEWSTDLVKLNTRLVDTINWKGALAGDRAALAELAAADPGVHDWLEQNKILGVVVHRAIEASIAMPPRWQDHLQQAAVTSVVFAKVLSAVGETLDRAGIKWVPIKGMDLRSRLYAWHEERPVTDVDVLIPLEAFDRGFAALMAAGWRSRCDEELLQRYDREEGYNWQAVSSLRVMLELHFRFWGMVAEEFAKDALNHAIPDPNLGVEGFRLSWPFAFTVCAVHAWQDPPRPLIHWWELKRIVEAGDATDNVEKIVAIARQWGLQLPVAHAAAVVASHWPESPCAFIAADLAGDLRVTERMAAACSRRKGLDHITWHTIYLARLLSGRSTRMGLKALLRRFWEHPGIVAGSTPSTLPWFARRGLSLLRAFGFCRV